MSLYKHVLLKSFNVKGILRGANTLYHCFRSGPKAGYPFRLKIESSAVCNLKCIMCPHAVGLRRPQGLLNFKNFRKVYDEVRPKYINLTEMGEPLLNPELFKIIKYASDRGTIVKLDTNGTLLTDENIIKLLDSKPAIVSVSLDAVNKKIYESIRKGANFDQVIKNLKRLVQIKNKNNFPTEIYLFFVMQKSNTGELLEFLKFGEELGVDSINGAIAMDIGENKNADRRAFEFDKDFLQKILDFKKNAKSDINVDSIIDVLNDPDMKPKNRTNLPCYHLWYSASVTWDGNLFPCEIFCDGGLFFGNVFEKKFMDIWNGSKCQKFRMSTLKREHPVCSDNCWADDTFVYNWLKIFYKIPLFKRLSYRK